MSTNVVAYTGP